jgi:hypothetical protein
VSNACQVRSGWSVTIDIRADSHGFTNMYESIENDTVAYE